jgi:hypothetical protein
MRCESAFMGAVLATFRRPNSTMPSPRNRVRSLKSTDKVQESCTKLRIALFRRLPERALNLLKPTGKLYVPPVLTISNAVFCIYAFRMILIINSDYFLKQH